MKILDLSRLEDFEAECVKLRERLEQMVSPDLIVGIATGGEHVVRNMGYGQGQKIIFVKRERASTKLKKTVKLDLLLRWSPTIFNNFVRRFEVLFREILFQLSGKRLEKGFVYPLSEVVGDIRSVLLIDDAVDSGATFLDVIGYISGRFPGVDIYTAALSQTFVSPALKVDFVLHYRTLVRGPWAMDVKAACREDSIE